jgi:hypothetical protein
MIPTCKSIRPSEGTAGSNLLISIKIEDESLADPTVNLEFHVLKRETMFAVTSDKQFVIIPKTNAIVFYEQRVGGMDYLTGKKSTFLVGAIDMSSKVNRDAFASEDTEIDLSQPKFTQLDGSHAW